MTEREYIILLLWGASMAGVTVGFIAAWIIRSQMEQYEEIG